MNTLCMKGDASRGGTMLCGISSLLLVLLTTACSSIPPPNEQLAVSRSAIDRAMPAGADAPVELAMAREKLDRANLAMTRRDYEEARFLAEEAEADAILAEAKARAVRSGIALQEVHDGIRMLREEMGRRAAGR